MNGVVRRLDATFDAGVVGFALWTLCAHATVALTGSLNALMLAAAAAGSAACVTFGLAWRKRRESRAASSSSPIPQRAESAESALWPRIVVGLAAAACAFALWLGAPLGVVWTIAVLLVCFECVRELLSREGEEREATPSGRRTTALLLALAAICIAVTWTAHRPDADDSFYVNLAVAAADDPAAALLAGDTLHRVPGAPLALPVYRVHSLELLVAALSRISGRPALDVAHLFLPALFALFVPFLYARMLRRLVPRAWPIATVLALAALLFTAAATHGWANFGLLRLHQGKGLLLTIVLPALVVYGLEFARSGDTRTWLRLAAAQVGAVGVSASALWLAPLVAGPAVLAGLAGTLHGGSGAGLRRLGIGLCASLYVLAAALVLRAETVAAFRDAAIPSPEMALGSLRLATQALRSVLAPGGFGAFLLFITLASWAFARERTARRLCAFSTAATLALWNPFLADWIAANATSAATYWRVLWLLPMPAMLAIFLSTPLQWAEGTAARGAVVVGALVVFGGAVLTMPRALALSAANQVRLDVPSWKVPPRDFEVARFVAAETGPDAKVLLPRHVAPWITTLHEHPTPLVVRVEYLPVLHAALGPEELERRLRLMRIVSGGRLDARATALLRSALREDDLTIVGLSRAAIGGPKLPRMLRQSGFQKIWENADYEVWRQQADAPGGEAL